MPDPTTVVQIVTGIVQELMDGRIRIKSDHVSTNHHDCNRETCAWKSKEVRILTLQQRVIGFGGVRSQFVLVTKFEYNGCDVNNARIALGGSGRFGNFIGFLSGMEYDASATAGASQIRSTPSGCERCCKEASCVEFDLTVYASGALTFGGGTTPYTVRVCGNGNVTIQQS